jgi:hypothetical protein
LDHANDHSHFNSVQNCCDRLVTVAQFDDWPKAEQIAPVNDWLVLRDCLDGHDPFSSNVRFDGHSAAISLIWVQWLTVRCFPRFALRLLPV